MKRKARILACMLALALVASAAGCSGTGDTDSKANPSGTTQSGTNNSEWAGKELVVTSFMDLTFAEGEPQTSDSFYYRSLIHQALDEFCQINNCTWSQLNTRDTTVLASAISAGESPDLYFGYGQYPNIAALGLVQDLTPYYEQISTKYGKDVLDINTYKGGYYAVSLPWNEYAMIGYNRDFFEENDIKTPRSYFEEGAWNWANFTQVCKDVTLDMDGDGTLDTAALCKHQWAKIFMTALTENTDGSVSVTLDTERNRANAQMLNELYSYGAIMSANQSVGAKVENQELIMAINTFDIYEISGSSRQGMNAYNKFNNYIEVVPVPVWKEGDSEYFTSQNFFQFAVPKGADAELSVALMDYILEAGVVCEMKMTSGYEFDYTGLQGLTPESKAYLEQVASRVEKEKEEIAENEYYSAEYNQKVIDFVTGSKITAARNYINNLSTRVTENDLYKALWELPPASSIASVSAALQLLVDEYNEQYVF